MVRDNSRRTRRNGRFFGRRVNCEFVPLLPAWAVSQVIHDPRKIAYMLTCRETRDTETKEAVRIIRHGPPPSLPEADSIELKRTDATIAHLRALQRALPRNGGQDVLLACPSCCSFRRALYGWKPGG